MDIASKPNLRAIASIHSRVRAAVLPARIIKVVLIVVIALAAVLLLLNLIGVNTGVDMPKLQ